MIDESNVNPVYGMSDHYLGEKGKRYFELLIDVGEGTAQTNLHVWEPYISETEDLLDFGCGVGSLLSKLNCQEKCGVEINPFARHYVREHLNINVVRDTSQLSDESFSRIIVNHVLEHIPNPYDALLEFRRLIKRDGLLLILLPLEDWRASGEKVFKPNDIDQHIYTWTPKLMGNLLWQAGFEPLELRIITRTFPGKFTTPLSKRLPNPLFVLVSWFVALVKHRRQLFAVARGK